MHGGTPLERLLRRERVLTAALLAVLCVLAWSYVLSGAGMGPPSVAFRPYAAEPVAGMDMPGAGRDAWTFGGWVLAVAMWWTMMIAMMLGSAAPTILLYARVRRHAAASAGETSQVAPAGAFTAGYLLVWLAFSLAAASVQWALQMAGLLADGLGSQSRWFSAAVLTAVGLYQFSSLKHACLARCRLPTDFLSRHWRAGRSGAVRLGVLHGGYCVGCCWLLMALLFVGGVMNLLWIAALTLLVTSEKILPGGRWIARAAGVAMLAWAAAVLA
jgi:predicted metal-binding membrane protein